jgi:FixJ family two-component response regulator
MMTESRILGSLPSRRVALVVDDDAAMRTLVKDLLAWEGIDTRELPSGDGLVEVVEREKIGLVVLDKEMPGGASGLDLVAYLSRRCPDVPVIVVTAFGGSRVRAEAMARGATTYLDKPFRAGDFLRAVRHALGLEPPGLAGPHGARSTDERRRYPW